MNKKLLLAGLTLCALTLWAAPAHAIGRVDYGIGAWCKGYFWGYNGTVQLGPWYSYWPLEAHFQTPAPTPYPYWPAPMNSPYAGGAPINLKPTPPAAAEFFQPVGYSSQAPCYWYGR
ncbi:MAG TPA: hypothetical protein VFA26_13105 [Gemmataceae bacterium]|nr:hypothetical protein [Gemmataceae bacterium]